MEHIDDVIKSLEIYFKKKCLIELRNHTWKDELDFHNSYFYFNQIVQNCKLKKHVQADYIKTCNAYNLDMKYLGAKYDKSS